MRKDQAKRNARARALFKKRKQYKKWYQKHKEKRAAYWKEWKYGLSPEAYTDMFQKQNGKCAIPSCPNPIEHIDHDHQTNMVRGLLCQKCNRGLGHFNDSPQLLREAADYVERPE